MKSGVCRRSVLVFGALLAACPGGDDGPSAPGAEAGTDATIHASGDAGDVDASVAMRRDGSMLSDAAGQDAAQPPVDGSAEDAASRADAHTDVGDAATPFVLPASLPMVLSAAGPDQLQSVAAGPDGSFYAAGFAASTVSGSRAVTVIKVKSDGELDPAFGTLGVATTELVFVGGADEIDLVVQPAGKVVVSATVASSTVVGDRDVALIRLDAAGDPDPGFGVADGIRVVNLNDAHHDGTNLVGLDAARGLAVGATGALFLHAMQRGTGTTSGGGGGPRTDTDFVIMKFSADGAPEVAYGGLNNDAKVVIDQGEATAVARAIEALSDGSVLAVGNANTGTGLQPVLIKLDETGTLDGAFGTGGIFHQDVLAVQADVTDVVVSGSSFLLTGYGRNAGSTNDWLSLRGTLPTGALDATWGGVPEGELLIDPSGTMLGSNCRGAVALPGGATLAFGSVGPGNMPAQDAAFMVLDSDGALDTRFGTGVHVIPFGDQGNDAFVSAAVSGSQVLLVGLRGGGASQLQTDTMNDDAWALLLPLQ
jgi:uncharacterized delta-60 repeat protein